VLVIEQAAVADELHVRHGVTAGVGDTRHVDDHDRPSAGATAAEAADEGVPFGFVRTDHVNRAVPAQDLRLAAERV
jgi:hypothetical protein